MKFLANISSIISNRNLATLMTTAFISLMGMTVQRLIITWHIYTKTDNSIFNAGVATFLMLLPELIVGPYIGAYMEHLNKKKLAVKIQLYQAVVNFILVVAVSTLSLNSSNIYFIIFPLLFIHGMLNSAFVPTKNTLVTACADKEILGSALSLHSTINNLSRFMAPTVAVYIYTKFGIQSCFIFNTICHLLVAASIGTIRVMRHVPSESKVEILKMWKDVLLYYKTEKSLGLLMLSSYCMSLIVNGYSTFIPVLTKDLLSLDIESNGLFQQSLFCAAILAGMTMINFSSYKKFPMYIFTCMVIAGVMIICIPFQYNFYSMLPMIVIMSFCFTLLKNMNRVTQINQAPPELKARIITLEWLLTSSFAGPSNLIAAGVLNYLGPRNGFIFLGSLLIVFAVLLHGNYRKSSNFNSKVSLM